MTVVSSPRDVGLTPRDKLALANDGGVWVAPNAIPHAVFRYLPDGTQDLRIVEQGQGPREFTRIERLETGPDDNLYVFGNRKLNRYTASGEYIDTRSFPPQILEMDLFPDGSMIANATLVTRDRAGYVFHPFAPDGALGESFGPETLGYEFDPVETRRRVAVSDSGTFWAAPMNRYVIELWNVAGIRQRRIIREVEWFDSWEGRYQRPYREPPVPRLWDITEDQQGLLWVLFILPAEHFTPVPEPESEAAFLAALTEPQGSYSPAFDVFVEVLDVASNTVVAQRRFANTMIRGGFLRNRHVAFTDVDEEREDQIFRITRLTLVR